ncbi:O-methyltransferase [Dichomitus squalens]|uniref:O-methyltransferase n=1 Tax=Dichomitus squalens TaxID=114155 RepID=A0A4Q9MKL0_9APHY|nr:O-methyltransferase [Dichomitus squalens]
MTFATLRASHAVIGGAISDIESTFGAHELDSPSLDVPYYANTSLITTDQQRAEELRGDPEVFGATNTIVAACGQLAAAVHKPFFSLVEGAQGGNLIACLQFLENTHTVEILREAGPQGLHVKDLAARITDVRRGANPNVKDIDHSKIGHVLRLLATYHWLQEVRPDVPGTKYDETDGVAAFTATSGDEVMKIHSVLADWLLKDGCSGEKNYTSPFNLAFKTDLKFYEWLEEPGNEARLTRFGHSMNGTRYWELAENIIHGFPWHELPQDSVVVDIGGGIGSVSVILAEAYPHLRFVVEDREPVVAIARQHADLFSSGRLSYHTQDFFAPRGSFEVPGVGTVSQPTVFLLRAVAHNWPDEYVVQILQHLRTAAGEHPKLLIVDNLLALACVDEDESADVRSLVPEGSPLLPNLGRASTNAYILDVSMMGLFSAKERTYREMDALTQNAGWKIERVKRAVGSLWAYTTVAPV